MFQERSRSHNSSSISIAIHFEQLRDIPENGCTMSLRVAESIRPDHSEPSEMTETDGPSTSRATSTRC